MQKLKGKGKVVNLYSASSCIHGL